MSSLRFHFLSFPSLRQVFLCIDAVSHYSKVPISPPFIKPCVLIEPPPPPTPPHISNSVWPLMFNPSFFPPFLSIRREMSSCVCAEAMSSAKGKQGQSFDCKIDRINANRMIYILTIMGSGSMNYCGANSVLLVH